MGRNESKSDEDTGASMKLSFHQVHPSRWPRIHVAKLNPMTTIQELAMDSPTIPGRPPLYMGPLGTSKRSLTPNGPITDVEEEEYPGVTVKETLARPELTRQTIHSSKQIATTLSTRSIQSVSTHAKSAIMTTQAISNIASTTEAPHSGQTQLETVSAIQFFPVPPLRETNSSQFATPNSLGTTKTPDYISAYSMGHSHLVPRRVPKKQRQLNGEAPESHGAVSWGRLSMGIESRFNCSLLPFYNDPEHLKILKKESFNRLPTGWRARDIMSNLGPNDQIILQEQAFEQAERFEILNIKDVAALSKELRHLDGWVERFQLAHSSVQARQCSLRSQVFQSLASTLITNPSHAFLQVNEQILAEADASVNNLVAKLQLVENRRIRVRQKLLEHIAAATTLPVPNYHADCARELQQQNIVTASSPRGRLPLRSQNRPDGGATSGGIETKSKSQQPEIETIACYNQAHSVVKNVAGKITQGRLTSKRRDVSNHRSILLANSNNTTSIKSLPQLVLSPSTKERLQRGISTSRVSQLAGNFDNPAQHRGERNISRRSEVSTSTRKSLGPMLSTQFSKSEQPTAVSHTLALNPSIQASPVSKPIWNGNVTVSVRVRHESHGENGKPAQQWQMNRQQATIAYHGDGGGIFHYDNVFTSCDNNCQVYDRAVKQLVRRVMEGRHGTVLAYGMTGTGKTFSMQGAPSSPGVIAQSITDIFSYILQSPSREFLLVVSYMEIYNDRIYDLLKAPAQKAFARISNSQHIKLREQSDGTVYATPLEQELVQSPSELASVIARGDQARKTASTQLNARSSRSHAVVQIIIKSRERVQNTNGKSSQNKRAGVDQSEFRISKLNFVDLAGSERADRCKERSKEAAYINKSLLTLGTIIEKLSASTVKKSEKHIRRDPHLPFRDSKLTRLLQGTLSGDSLISIICTIQLDSAEGTAVGIYNKESLNTLKFASRAKKRVIGTGKIAEKRSDENCDCRSMALLEQYREEILALRRQLMIQTSTHSESMCSDGEHTAGHVAVADQTIV